MPDVVGDDNSLVATATVIDGSLFSNLPKQAQVGKKVASLNFRAAWVLSRSKKRAADLAANVLNDLTSNGVLNILAQKKNVFGSIGLD